MSKQLKMSPWCHTLSFEELLQLIKHRVWARFPQNSFVTPLKMKHNFPNVTAKCFSAWFIVDKKIDLRGKQTEATEGGCTHFVWTISQDVHCYLRETVIWEPRSYLSDFITWNEGTRVGLKGSKLVDIVFALLFCYPPGFIWVITVVILWFSLHWKGLWK